MEDFSRRPHEYFIQIGFEFIFYFHAIVNSDRCDKSKHNIEGFLFCNIRKFYCDISSKPQRGPGRCDRDVLAIPIVNIRNAIPRDGQQDAVISGETNRKRTIVQRLHRFTTCWEGNGFQCICFVYVRNTGSGGGFVYVMPSKRECSCVATRGVKKGSVYHLSRCN